MTKKKKSKRDANTSNDSKERASKNEPRENNSGGSKQRQQQQQQQQNVDETTGSSNNRSSPDGTKNLASKLDLDELLSIASDETSQSSTQDCSSSSSDHGPQNYSLSARLDIRRKSFFILLCLTQILFAPRILQKAGVTELDLWEEFVSKSIMPNLEHGWGMLNGTIGGGYHTYERSRPGYRLAKEGAKAKYPIIMVPGFVTSGLELWGGEECARKHFRQRLWGSLSTAHTFFTDRDCWKRHLSLDPFTGSDPENIRLRAAQGFEAADYFMATYWVWNKLIENLADVGYDGSKMVMMSYDWRLAFSKLEERDGYLTKLRHTIEAFHETSGEKVVLVAHSMGSNLVFYFFAWVTRDKSEGGGGCGKDWVEKHVRTVVNIAGPLLGVSKAAAALLSGEMKDTTALLGPIGNMFEQFFGRRLRKDLWNTWGSLWAMLPMGGNEIWGPGADLCNSSAVVDGLFCRSSNTTTKEKQTKALQSMHPAIAPMIAMVDPRAKNDTERAASKENVTGSLSSTVSDSALGRESTFELPVKESSTKAKAVEDNAGDASPYVNALIKKFSSSRSLTVEETLAFLKHWGAGYGPGLVNANLHTFKRNDKLTKEMWHDVTTTPLPDAPSLTVYCMYGVGLNTERSYFYKLSCGENETNCSRLPRDPPLVMDTDVNDPAQNTKLGIRFSDGDGSVPLLSMGYMCVDGWKRAETGLNPSRSTVITREYLHKQEFQVDDPMRGGPEAADHVDILGNIHVLEDVVKLVTGHNSSSVTTHLKSDIADISNRIKSYPGGGAKVPTKKSVSMQMRRLFGL